MRYRKEHICSVMLIALLLIVVGGLLTSCSNDDTQESKSTSLQIMGFTRSGDPTQSYEGKGDYSPINLFLVDGETQKQGSARYNGSEWRISGFTNEDIGTSHTYSLYGFAPAEAIGSSLTVGAENTTLTLTSLPAVNAKDVCFIVGLQRTENQDTPKGSWDDYEGNFSFTTGSTAETKNLLYLLMDHVYASVCFTMTIDEEYAALRSIKIKKMELRSTQNTTTATITLTPNNTGADPVQSVTYSSATGSSCSATFFESKVGDELTTFDTDKAKEYTCCFLPGLSNALTLVTTYDVYDRKGNKIDERTASNKLPALTALRGDRVTINLTVAPTYLGVLSDPDLDNPTITIN
ncbi:MAG: hypothetical protein II429_10735 [Prevotella sp.]|nr:hypothetical protein [Prevotella sp.]